MKKSNIIPVTFLAAATVLSGLTFATAQTEADNTTAPTEVSESDGRIVHAKFGGGRGDHRGGRAMFGQILKNVDADADGSVSQTEIDSYRSALVTGADQSGEGNISLDEFESIYLEIVRNRMVDTFQNLDEDGDGVITQAEMDERFGNIVERMDRNDDGVLNGDDRRGDGHRHDRDHRRGDGHRRG
ncbi:hypothetical protein [Amaricoccus tamworthensis]|uniref:hypothetical protein n=1 Tax=Amaricoccus tamworthensis TaxID=57002 RepID=UPI003C7B4E54